MLRGINQNKHESTPSFKQSWPLDAILCTSNTANEYGDRDAAKKTGPLKIPECLPDHTNSRYMSIDVFSRTIVHCVRKLLELFL